MADPTASARLGLDRRRFIGALAAAVVAAGWSAPARAAQLVVEVPGRAVGAIASAVGGNLVRVSVGKGLEPGQIRIDGQAIDVSRTILLKGKGAARARYLDDPRNATKLGGNIRDALKKVAPAQAETFAANHRAWSRPFVRRVLAWQKKLESSPVRGRRVSDPHGRRYLLEWAGATVVSGAAAPPAALAKAPEQPDAPTLAAYEAYVGALVDAVT